MIYNLLFVRIILKCKHLIQERSFPMFKKILKVLLVLAGIAAFIAGIVYFINSVRKTDDDSVEEDDFEEEEHLDYMDALDLSSLKFSRHYVDLR